ncbi:MAG TPA: nuclear transport factor 2 family protein [Gemmatimonadaceae bacterium]|nr:nuclear transport factor 2 family protein [Gemmatimonadaceae bacterium]
MRRVCPTLLITVALTGPALAVGCAGAGPDRMASADTTAVRAQIDSTWRGVEGAMVAGDTTALARFYTDSASFAETGVPTMRGRAALLSGAAQAFASMRYVESRFTPEVTEVRDDRVFQFGTYRDVVRPNGQGALEVRGRVAAVLERGSSGSWRVGRLVVIRDTVVALPPAPR